MGEFTRHAAQGKEEEKPVGHDTSGTIRHDTVYCLGSLNFKSFPVGESLHFSCWNYPSTLFLVLQNKIEAMINFLTSFSL